MLSRIVEPVNRERLELLTRAEEAAAPDPPGVEAILEVFLAGSSASSAGGSTRRCARPCRRCRRTRCGGG